MPSLYPEITCWGLMRGGWDYVLTFNSLHRYWSLSAKISGAAGKPIFLGTNLKKRADAERIFEQHAGLVRRKGMH